MEKFCILILVAFFVTKSLDKAESVQLEKLEELSLQTFDEIFGEGWWDKDEAEDLKTPTPTNFGQNVYHQIDRHNTQLGQIEPNSTDQNPPLTESDHSENAKNGEDQNEITSNAEDDRKRKIVDKFHAMKEEFKQKGKYSSNEWDKIENEIAQLLKRKAELKQAGIKNSYSNQINETVAKELGFCFKTIYNWKSKLDQTKPNQKYSDSERKELLKH
uniref:Uncharacterized protein n=1 Tax=Globodera rostochiensis TaxID=31243 RepID=A0A914H9B8_GLORO